MLSFCSYIFVCFFAYFMKSAFDFWILAMLAATSQCGIQALSRAGKRRQASAITSPVRLRS